MSTYVGDEDVCERPDEGVLFLIPLSQPFAEFDVSVKDAALDDFQTYSQIFGEEVWRNSLQRPVWLCL
jgi:hypothetical protein